MLSLQHVAQNQTGLILCDMLHGQNSGFDFLRHVAATKFCRGDKILSNRPPNVEAFTPGDLSLQPIAAMSVYDLSHDCTHKEICCSNVMQRFVASCVPAFKFLGIKSSDFFLFLFWGRLPPPPFSYL